MAKSGVKRIAKLYGVTIPFLKKKMMLSGVIDEYGLPSPECSGYFEEKPYGDNGDTYLVWDIDFLIGKCQINEPTQEEIDLHITSRFNAEDKLCDAFVRIGLILKIKEDKHLDAYRIIEQCKYSDPHFLGGPCFASFVNSTEDVRILKERLQQALYILEEPINGIASKKKSKEIKHLKSMAENAVAWLEKQVVR